MTDQNRWRRNQVEQPGTAEENAATGMQRETTSGIVTETEATTGTAAEAGKGPETETEPEPGTEPETVEGIHFVTVDDPGTPVIHMRKIIKRYYIGTENELEVLHGIDLDIHAGELTSIVGESGSGKSTLMNIIGFLDHPTEGEYEFEGEDVLDKKDKELSAIRNQKVGFVFQTYNLIPRMSALRNVEVPLLYARMPKAEREDRAAELLEQVGMKERMNHNPDELSGGQKQRVAIARALANDPSLILADEPTGALDQATSQQIMDIFHDLHERYHRTILIITHSQALAEETTRILTLLDGRIVGERKGKNAG